MLLMLGQSQYLHFLDPLPPAYRKGYQSSPTGTALLSVLGRAKMRTQCPSFALCLAPAGQDDAISNNMQVIQP